MLLWLKISILNSRKQMKCLFRVCMKSMPNEVDSCDHSKSLDSDVGSSRSCLISLINTSDALKRHGSCSTGH